MNKKVIFLLIGCILIIPMIFQFLQYEISIPQIKRNDEKMTNIFHELYQQNRRQLVTFNPIVDRPNINWITNRTIHASLLRTCEFTRTHLSNYFRYQHFCENITIEHSRKVLSPIPLTFVSWPTIVAKVCPTILPHFSHHKIEKGYGMSHLQIWMEFVFYDLDILEARLRKPPEYITSNSYSSVSGIFQSFENGTLLKNNFNYQDDDLIIIIEEDSIPHLNITEENLLHFQSELSHLSDSVLYLRPCAVELMNHNEDHMNSTLRRRLATLPGESLSSATIPLHNSHHHSHSHSHAHHYTSGHSCFSAYAMTRKVARYLSDKYDICGKFLDHQIVQIIKHSNFSIIHSQSNLFS